MFAFKPVSVKMEMSQLLKPFLLLQQAILHSTFISNLNWILLVNIFYKCFVENIFLYFSKPYSIVLSNYTSDLNCILLVNGFFVLEGDLNIFTSYVSSCMHLKFYQNLQLGYIFDSLNHLIPCYNIHIHSLENNFTFLKCFNKCLVTHNSIVNLTSPTAWRRHLAPVLPSWLKSLDECISANVSCTCN